MKQNPKQVDAFNDPSRHRYLNCGRRGGKTFILVEELLRSIDQAPYRNEVVYIGPTNSHAKEVIWEPIEDALDALGWRYKAQVSKQRFELMGKRKIYIIGAEKISRVRGRPLHFAALDELAYFNSDLDDVWRAVRPALSDTKGRSIVATTPDGKGSQAYEWFIKAQTDPQWSLHTWHTLDNPWIDPDEIEDAKRELDEKSFRQEYLATWESFEGLAYYNFDEETHVRKQPDINYSKAIHMSFDFNVNPTTLLLSQRYGDTLRYKQEYSLKHSSTEATVHQFCNDFKNKAEYIKIKIRGDASGKSRSSTTGKSDYHYVEEILKSHGFNYVIEILPKNPPIVDRLKHVNGWLKPVAGNHRIEIDPSCKDLIRDLSSQELNGRHPSDKNNLGHKADALGYDVYYEHKIGDRKKSRTLEL